MNYLVSVFTLVSLTHLTFAAPAPLTTNMPCDVPLNAASDPSVNYAPESPHPDMPPTTMDNGFASGAPSVTFPIETPLGGLQRVPGGYIDSRVPVGSVTVDGRGTSMDILGLKPPAPQPQTSAGCTHLNGAGR